MEQLELLEQPQRAIDKSAVVTDLLRGHAENVDTLEHKTGWGRQITQHVLLQLVVDGRVKCVRQSGHLVYALRMDTPFRTHSNQIYGTQNG